jgi:hypothetical protein
MYRINIESELSAENPESELIVSLNNSSDASENETPNLEAIVVLGLILSHALSQQCCD